MDKQMQSSVRDFFKKELADAIREKLESGHKLSKFNVNPFVITALSSGVFGASSSTNMAKALLYPRVFGTSLSTTFGDKMQRLCIQHLDAQASAIPGMDIEFEDKKDGGRTIVQLKAGPNTINSGDVKPILSEMQSAHRLLLTNHASDIPVFAVAITYGTLDQISSHYWKIHDATIGRQPHVPIYIGIDFWQRLTGDAGFYAEMIQIAVDLFEEEDYSSLLEEDVINLARQIEEAYFVKGKLDPSKL